MVFEMRLRRPLRHAGAAIVCAVALLAGGAPAGAQSSQPSGPPPAPPPAVVFLCDDGTTIVARFPDTATALLQVGDDRYELTTTTAASGVRYAGAGVVFWTHHGDARFERRATSTTCKGPGH
ncbi:hypothetical protein GCM10010994_42530 [Chelatococcus reniformis]|uniref:C-type lysozyme inhibitor domain-containing protein n=2 Tax=Chelatococcus reniformis TaxID=1494448 RepID=A0A916UQF1_9HYPH|nr:hypothetical protein GCM10010994_42530 [Chelatococcus reniformis]